jgi:hypothetical protein
MKKLNKKNRLLAVGVVLFGLLSYQLALKKTWSNFRAYEKGKSLKNSGQSLPHKLGNLKAKEGRLDALLAEMNLNGGSQQSELLKLLNTEIAETEVRIEEFLSPHRKQVGEEVISTYRFTLKGDFKGILKVIHTLENSKGFGAVTHIDYQRVKNYRSGRSELLATVLISHFE